MQRYVLNFIYYTMKFRNFNRAIKQPFIYKQNLIKIVSYLDPVGYENGIQKRLEGIP